MDIDMENVREAIASEEKFLRIVNDGLCIGCGLCQSILGSDKVLVTKSESGDLRPQLTGELSVGDVDLVYATCPGTTVEGLSTEVRQAAPHRDLVWGEYHQIVLGWAKDAKVRHEGSTGGVLTALGQYLLYSDRVSFVLHARASVAEPTFGEAIMSFSEEDVLAGAGSRYGPTAVLINLEAALARNEPFALIAKPCDLNAVRNLAHHDDRIDRLIKYWLAPVCGGYMPDASMSKFFERHSINRDEVAAVRYRGLGCPGPTTVKLSNGSERNISYLDVWGEDSEAWSLPFRCKICPDGIGEAADIVAADIWPDGAPDRNSMESDPGSNSMIVRTSQGTELLSSAIDAGYISISNQLDVDFMNATQPHQVERKKYVRARYDGLKRAGKMTPDAIDMRLDELAAANDPQANEEQERGAFSRASDS